MVLLIDNYDSFVHNLARYVRELGEETHRSALGLQRRDAATLIAEGARLRAEAAKLAVPTYRAPWKFPKQYLTA